MIDTQQTDFKSQDSQIKMIANIDLNSGMVVGILAKKMGDDGHEPAQNHAFVPIPDDVDVTIGSSAALKDDVWQFTPPDTNRFVTRQEFKRLWPIAALVQFKAIDLSPEISVLLDMVNESDRIDRHLPMVQQSAKAVCDWLVKKGVIAEKDVKEILENILRGVP